METESLGAHQPRGPFAVQASSKPQRGPLRKFMQLPSSRQSKGASRWLLNHHRGSQALLVVFFHDWPNLKKSEQPHLLLGQTFPSRDRRAFLSRWRRSTLPSLGVTRGRPVVRRCTEAWQAASTAPLRVASERRLKAGLKFHRVKETDDPVQSLPQAASSLQHPTAAPPAPGSPGPNPAGAPLFLPCREEL